MASHRTGKRKRVMIACVTFETVKVTDPTKFYECDRVHLIHYADRTKEAAKVFVEFYDRVCDILKKGNRRIEIVEHNREVRDFPGMLSEVLAIIEKEKIETNGDCDIFVNISAGSPEFTAAAAIGAMMSENVTPFTVPAQSFTISSEEDVRRAYYRDGMPVGLTDRTKEPRAMPCYAIEKPKEHLVRGLRILNERNERNLRTKSTDMVKELKDLGLWYRSSEGKAKQTEAVQYRREYTEKWEQLGWIEKNELRKRFELTDEGKSIIATFYVIEINSSGN